MLAKTGGKVASISVKSCKVSQTLRAKMSVTKGDIESSHVRWHAKKSWNSSEKFLREGGVGMGAYKGDSLTDICV